MIIGTTLIVLTWVLFIGMGLPIWAGVIITIVASCILIFGLLFGVYFFNLDMKALAALKPLLSKVYDHRKRDKNI